MKILTTNILMLGAAVFFTGALYAHNTKNYLLLKQNTDATVLLQDTTVNTTDSIKQNGLSYKTAIVINQPTQIKGAYAEYQWLYDHYKSYTLINIGLQYVRGKPFDIYRIKTMEGKELVIHFDASAFHDTGKRSKYQ